VSCCGGKRSRLRGRAAVTIAPPRSAPPPPPVEEGERPAASDVAVEEGERPAASDVAVEYRGDAPVVLHRALSGRLYTFSPARRVRSVSARDAPALLLDRDFRLWRERTQSDEGASSAANARRASG
jgi:hypothetical protein